MLVMVLGKESMSYYVVENVVQVRLLNWGCGSVLGVLRDPWASWASFPACHSKIKT